MILRAAETGMQTLAAALAIWIIDPATIIEAIAIGAGAGILIAIIQHATGLTYMWGHDEGGS